jgi:hypothetical protein
MPISFRLMPERHEELDEFAKMHVNAREWQQERAATLAAKGG